MSHSKTENNVLHCVTVMIILILGLLNIVFVSCDDQCSKYVDELWRIHPVGEVQYKMATFQVNKY
jgi:hypothetical protein